MRKGIDKFITALWGLLALGFTVQVVGNSFWRWLVIGGVTVFVASAAAGIYNGVRLRRHQLTREQRQQCESGLRIALMGAVIGLIAAVVPRTFWVEIGGGFIVLAMVLLILSYLLRSMFTAPKKRG